MGEQTSMTTGNLREEPGAGNPHARICEGEAEWHSYSTDPPDGRGMAQILACLFCQVTL